MKAKILFQVLLLVLLTPAFVTAQAVTTEITGTEIFDPMGLFGNGSIGNFLSPGQVSCPGAQPTGDPAQPCPTGSRIKIRGATAFSVLIAEENDPWLTGLFSIAANSDLDANATGHAWGTFRLELDAGGVWEGSWTGKRAQVGNLVWTTHIRGVGHGRGGIVEGKQLRFDEVVTSPAPVSIAYLGNVTAEVISPPSSE
jgi:hypothetical protein